MEYIIIAFLVILVGFLFLIYKKLDPKQNNNDEIKSSLDLERERKKDLNEFKDTILEKINTQSTSLKEDFVSIKERVSTLQKVQEEMGKLATEVIDFKNLFNNKSERGRLGEEYLEDLISDTMSKKHYKFQHTFKNGSRVDCLLTFGSSDLSIPIDSKFSWENYKKMCESSDETQKKKYASDFTQNINDHINAVSKYVIDGETAPIAYMFIGQLVFTKQLLKVTETLLKRQEKKCNNGVPDTFFSFKKL